MRFVSRLLPFVAGILAAASAFAEDTFRFVPATVRVMEGVGATATFSVVRQGDLATDATVDVFTDNDSAFAGFEYIAVSNTLSFAAGVATNTVSIPLLDNGVVRSGDICFFVRLRNPSPGTALGVPANATVFILEDDVYEGADIDDSLYATECPLWEISGITGDLASFSPTGKVFAVQNWSPDTAVAYSASCDAAWIDLRPAAPSGILPVGSQTSLAILFAPAAASYPPGTYDATLAIRNETTGAVHNRLLRLVVRPVPGTLAPPLDSIAPFDDRTLPFGSVALGSSASATITLSNADMEHGVRLRDFSCAGSDDFTVTLPDPVEIEVPAAGSVAIPVVFEPSAAGDHSAVFGFATDDPDSPALTFQLTGTGYIRTPDIRVSPSAFSVTNLVGETASLTLSISNLPNAEASLDYSLFLVCKGTPETATTDAVGAAAVAESARSPRKAAKGAEVRELIVRFDDDGTAGGGRRTAGARAAFRGGRRLQSRPDMAVVPVPDGESAADAIAELRAMPGVRAVQPNHRYHALAVPNDPQFPQQWGLANDETPGLDIRATQGWDIATSATELVVAVIDSGADLDHPDLVDNLWVNPGEIPDNGLDDDGNGWVDDVHGVDFVNATGNPGDDNGHGTHCCGIVGARGDNGVGVCGVCWRVRLMPLKFLDAKGYGTTANAIDAIEYAVAHGASVISASWGGDPDEDDELLREAIERAGDAGVLFVCAAGNDGADIDEMFFSPAGFEGGNIVTVVNLAKTGALNPGSNYGATRTHLAAPGTGILSTYHKGGGYTTLSGTSMACPHVSGAAALVRALHPELSPADVKALLLDTVARSGGLAGRCSTGGYLDLHAALGVVRGTNAWLTVNAEGGTLAAGECEEIALAASATALSPGTYRAFVHVRSNDLDAPDCVVEVTHVVLARSRIEDADWRARYGLPDDDSADEADFDGDGFTNVEEWLLGTDPTDPESAFRILGIEWQEGGAAVVWASATNRVYRVLSTDDLKTPFEAIADGIPGEPDSTRYLDIRALSPSNRFYRLETTVP